MLDQFRRAARPSKGISHATCVDSTLQLPSPACYMPLMYFSSLRQRQAGTKGIVTQLARVQRRAATHTGALRTTPTDLLDAHADLIPFTLLVDKICHAAALRLPPSRAPTPFTTTYRKLQRLHSLSRAKSPFIILCLHTTFTQPTRDDPLCTTGPKMGALVRHPDHGLRTFQKSSEILGDAERGLPFWALSYRADRL